MSFQPFESVLSDAAATSCSPRSPRDDADMRNPRSLPGAAQLLLAVVVMGVSVAVAHLVGLSDDWATIVGIFVGALLLTLWEAVGGRA